MSIGFYHWIWVVARVLSRKLGDGSYSELVVLLGEEIFFRVDEEIQFSLGEEKHIFYQKSQKKSIELPLLVTWTPSASKTSSSSDRWQDSCDLDSFTALATWEGLTLCSRSWRYLIVICYTYLYHKFIETMEIWQKWLYLTDDVDHHHYNRCWSKWLTPSPSSSPSASGAICCFSACSSLIAWVLKRVEAGVVKTWEYTIWCRKNEKKAMVPLLPLPRRPLSEASWQ